MKNPSNPIKDILQTSCNVLGAIYHGSRALKTYSIAKRIQAESRLYKLLHNQEALTKQEQEQLAELLKKYKKTLGK